MNDYLKFPQVDASFYWGDSYDKKEQFISYWHQINEVLTLEPHKLLEVGVGQGFVSRYLIEKGIEVTTIDIDERLNPDYVGSVTCMPFADNYFEAVLCCEVLEHLPFEELRSALSEISRVTSKHAIISLPDSSYYFGVCLQLFLFGEFRKLISLPWGGLRDRAKTLLSRKQKRAGLEGVHYWEIGKAGLSLHRLICVFDSAGFSLKKNYRVFENPYHRFFILEKSDLGFYY